MSLQKHLTMHLSQLNSPSNFVLCLLALKDILWLKFEIKYSIVNKHISMQRFTMQKSILFYPIIQVFKFG